MKLKLIFLVSFFAFSNFSFSQSLQYLNASDKSSLTELPVVLNYKNSAGEKGATIFEYDGNNLLRKGKWELNDKSRNSLNYYFYNEAGQLTEFYREFSDSLTGSIKFEYNKDGKVELETFSRSDGVSGTGQYIYNENGQLEKIVANKMKGFLTGEIIYQQNGNSPSEKALIMIEGNQAGTITFKYDGDKLITEYWDFPNRWNQTFEWIYKPVKTIYTSSNVFINENNRFRLEEENYDFNGTGGSPSFFKYDDSGKLSQKVFVRTDSLKTITSYNYSPEGLLQKSIRNYNDGKVGTFIYQWNDFRKLKSRQFLIDNEEIGTEDYFYNKTGKLDSAQWVKFDTWLTGNISFNYLPTGQIDNGFFKGKDGFDADIHFSYDQDGNLDKILWKFSFGKTQTYWFNYKDQLQTK